MANPGREPASAQRRGSIARLLPILLVVAVPLSFSGWWWVVRKQDPQNPSDSVAAGEQDGTGASTSQADPWQDITQTIFPMGVVEKIHHTDDLTYLAVRFSDGDRWVATPRVEFQPGDRVQVEVPPRSVKENYKVKSLDHVFRRIIFVGADRVKLIEAASSDGVEQ